MNRKDILPLLRSDKTDEDYKQLRDTLREVDEVELFYGLYPIAVERPYQTPAFPILSAGNLLFDLNPACQISCVEAIRAMLAGWDVSLEEVPFYVYKQFGMVAIQEAINQLRSEALSNEQRIHLDTVKYWAEIADREGIETIEKRRSE